VEKGMCLFVSFFMRKNKDAIVIELSNSYIIEEKKELTFCFMPS